MATTPQGYEPLSPDANGSTPAKSPISAYALELLRRGGDWCGGARRRERRPRCAAKPAEFGSLNYDIFESDVSARESERWRPDAARSPNVAFKTRGLRGAGRGDVDNSGETGLFPAQPEEEDDTGL